MVRLKNKTKNGGGVKLRRAIGSDDDGSFLGCDLLHHILREAVDRANVSYGTESIVAILADSDLPLTG